MNRKQVVLPAELEPDHRNLLVRIGSRYDGGYIIAASLLADTEQVLSFGLGYNWDFEKDMLALTAVTHIDCYDHTVTPQAIKRLHALSILKYLLKTRKRKVLIAACRDYYRFFPGNPRITHHMMEVGTRDDDRSTSLAGALERLGGSSRQIFLKCDIEGSEYAIMDDILANADRFCGIALEFHDLHTRFDAFLEAMRALRRTHYLDHIHVNNTSKYDARGIPSVLEVALSRRDTDADGDAAGIEAMKLPVSRRGGELDTPNNPDKPDVEIVYR